MTTARVALGAAALLAAAACQQSAPPVPPAPPPAAGLASPAASAPPVALAPARLVTHADRAMGTRVTLAAMATASHDEARVRAAFEAALVEIRRLESLMTTWRDDSEIARVNAAAGRAAVPVSEDTWRVLEASVWASRASGGAFDVTFEAMHGIWKFDQDRDPHPPAASAVASARRLVDFRRLRLDPARRTALLERTGMRIGLGGIGKGYAVDRAARVLLDAGLADFAVQAGGDLYTHGEKAPGIPWSVGIRDPRGPEGTYFATMGVSDHAFSTAGDYERSYVKAGRRYHHIIDPHTGWPATASRSVTIWATDALTADALDDAVFILGPERGLALVESVDGCGAVIVDAANRVHVSKRLEGKVTLLRPPTDGP